ncbi:MAG: hypothetical protein GY805_25955 [Chloroflexi bacterium]|nr:hypothetical protein [Chloroflexota bacterium]
MRKLLLTAFFFLTGLLAACATAAPENPPVATIPIPTAAAIPPTFTPDPNGNQFSPAVPIVTVTQAPLPTVETSTPIPYGADVVELRLKIPAIGLDRRLQGSVSSQIILVDESSGFSVQRDNQASVLLDLQQVLPELLLAPVPSDCDSCVTLTYSLPFSNIQGTGWLRDPVLLASLENYFTITLGPHFPPETIVGLRRSASPFAPAHSVAVTADGRLHRWLANEGEAASIEIASPELLAAFESLNIQALAQQYAAPCPGSPLESLLLAGQEVERLVVLVCPEFALSANLQPLYVHLDDVLNELLAGSETTIARPPAGFPLTAVLDYQRVDGTQLSIFMDGTAVVNINSSQPMSTTLSSSQVISLTTNLLGSGSLRTGLTTFVPPENEAGEVVATATPSAPRSVLLLRGPAGVYDAQWFNTANIPVLAELNELLDLILSGEAAVSTDSEQDISTTPTASTTPETAASATPATPSATSTPTNE